MTVFYTDTFVLPLPDAHRFPMRKYALLRERVAASGLIADSDLRLPPAATDDELRLAHTDDYLRRAIHGELTKKEVQRIGFPWSDGLIERSRRSVGATIAAARSALDIGVGVNLAGGTHHAFADAGEGFCVFNDTVVAARVLQQEGKIRRVLVVDLDVHQGNGTASITADDDSIFTLSLHGAKNFPARKVPSDLDVPLADETGDEAYMDALRDALKEAVRSSKPEFVFYLAGADPYQHDRLGRLSLTKDGLRARDEHVLGMCQQLGLPVSVAMAGGYAHDVEAIADIHFTTVRTALALR